MADDDVREENKLLKARINELEDQLKGRNYELRLRIVSVLGNLKLLVRRYPKPQDEIYSGILETSQTRLVECLTLVSKKDQPP